MTRKDGDPGTVSGMTKAISSVTGSFTLRVQDDDAKGIW